MMNQCNFIGRVGKKPEIRYGSDGTAVVNFSIACSEKWKNKAGEFVEKTEWVAVVAFGRLAEIIGECFDKGLLVFVTGKLQTRKWQDKNGNDRYTTEIIARDMKMLGGRKAEQSAIPPGDDDVPF